MYIYLNDSIDDMHVVMINEFHGTRHEFCSDFGRYQTWIWPFFFSCSTITYQRPFVFFLFFFCFHLFHICVYDIGEKSYTFCWNLMSSGACEISYMFRETWDYNVNSMRRASINSQLVNIGLLIYLYRK